MGGDWQDSIEKKEPPKPLGDLIDEFLKAELSEKCALSFRPLYAATYQFHHQMNDPEEYDEFMRLGKEVREESQESKGIFVDSATREDEERIAEQFGKAFKIKENLAKEMTLPRPVTYTQGMVIERLRKEHNGRCIRMGVTPDKIPPFKEPDASGIEGWKTLWEEPNAIALSKDPWPATFLHFLHYTKFTIASSASRLENVETTLTAYEESHEEMNTLRDEYGLSDLELNTNNKALAAKKGRILIESLEKYRDIELNKTPVEKNERKRLLTIISQAGSIVDEMEEQLFAPRVGTSPKLFAPNERELEYRKSMDDNLGQAFIEVKPKLIALAAAAQQSIKQLQI